MISKSRDSFSNPFSIHRWISPIPCSIFIQLLHFLSCLFPLNSPSLPLVSLWAPPARTAPPGSVILLGEAAPATAPHLWVLWTQGSIKTRVKTSEGHLPVLQRLTVTHQPTRLGARRSWGFAGRGWYKSCPFPASLRSRWWPHSRTSLSALPPLPRFAGRGVKLWPGHFPSLFRP